jgi:predicted transcriptional regulator
MMVRAIQMAFYDGRRVRVGDLVDVPDGYKAAWAVPASEPVAAPAAAPRTSRRRESVALSQVARESTKGPLDELV